MSELFLGLFVLSELIHFSFLVLFLFALIRIILVRYVPYTAMYVSLYIGIHAIYNGCPITTTQNFLAIGSGVIPVTNNDFLKGFLPEYEIQLRILVLFACTILLLLAYKQFKKLGVKPEYWMTFWYERKMNLNKLPIEMTSK